MFLAFSQYQSLAYPHINICTNITVGTHKKCSWLLRHTLQHPLHQFECLNFFLRAWLTPRYNPITSEVTHFFFSFLLKIFASLWPFCFPVNICISCVFSTFSRVCSCTTLLCAITYFTASLFCLSPSLSRIGEEGLLWSPALLLKRNLALHQSEDAGSSRTCERAVSKHDLLGLCLVLDILREPLEELGVLPLVNST